MWSQLKLKHTDASKVKGWDAPLALLSLPCDASHQTWRPRGTGAKKFTSLEFSRRSRLPRRLPLGFSTLKKKKHVELSSSLAWRRHDEDLRHHKHVLRCRVVMRGGFLLPRCVTSLAGKLLQVAEFVFGPQSCAAIKVRQIPLRPTSYVGIYFFNWGISWLLLGWKFLNVGKNLPIWIDIMIRNVPNLWCGPNPKWTKKNKKKTKQIQSDYTASALKIWKWYGNVLFLFLW